MHFPHHTPGWAPAPRRPRPAHLFLTMASLATVAVRRTALKPALAVRLLCRAHRNGEWVTPATPHAPAAGRGGSPRSLVKRKNACCIVYALGARGTEARSAEGGPGSCACAGDRAALGQVGRSERARGQRDACQPALAPPVRFLRFRLYLRAGRGRHCLLLPSLVLAR